MDPLLLQKQVRDNSEELMKFLDDLKSWEKDMKRKDQELLEDASDNAAVPPVRSKIKRSKYTSGSNQHEEMKHKDMKHKDMKRISSYDYSAWDRFDVEKACAEVDKEKQLEPEKFEAEEETEEDAVKSREQAMYEKELGNCHVKNQKWKDAIDCYTQAIQHYQYDAIFYANRALCYLKTNKPKLAETDCTTAIQLDNLYVKAYQRRALARLEIGLLDDAKVDFQKVLELEPNNSAAKNELSRLQKRTKPTHGRKEEKSVQKVTDKQNKPSELKSKRQKFSGDSLKETGMQKKLEEIQTVLGAGGDTGVREAVQSLICDEDEEVVAIQKPPHLHSKRPMKAISIQEVETFADLIQLTVKTERPIACPSDKKIEEITTEVHVSNEKPLQDTLPSSSTHVSVTKEHVRKKYSVAERNDPVPEQSQALSCRTIELPLAPKTYVQFLCSWKLIKNNAELRYQFLKQIPGKGFPQLFQDSLESKEFSEIIASLDTDFLGRNEPIYPYLLGLSEVKRFSALVMFLTKSEKAVIKKLLQYCCEKEECSKEDLLNLLKCYEVN